MAKPSVLMLYNEPLLPKDHPDAASEHTVVEIAEDMVRILSEEGFRVMPLQLGTDPAVLWTELKKLKPDVVFNLFEGNLDNTETESFVAGLLDWSGIPYTGSPFPALSLARAKHTAKYLFQGAGLPTADFQIVQELPGPVVRLDYPVIVKPATQDASIGVDQESVCTNERQLAERVELIFTTYGPPVLIEEYIPGREFNVALIELPSLQALAPMEITMPEEKPGSWPIYTYGGKWNVGSTDYEATRSRFPTDLSAANVEDLYRIALSAYHLLGCRDYARIDFRMKPNGDVYLLEVNPNPDISTEDLSACLALAGLSRTEFIVRLVNQALSRRHTPKPTFAPVRSDASTTR
jgi:D-alanine-D-alanine ligase